MGTLKLDLKPGESVQIGDLAVITLEEKSGKVARIAFKADKSVPIKRLLPNQGAKFVADFGITGLPAASGAGNLANSMA